MIDTSGAIGFQFGGGGLTLDDNTRLGRLFKITSGVNPYAAQEVTLNEADGAKANGGYAATVAQKILWEVNGLTTVKADRIVLGWPNPFGVGFYFDSSLDDGCESVTFRVMIDLYISTTGSPITAITLTKKFRQITVDKSGCVTLGVPYCEATSGTCADGETAAITYYCLGGKCFAVYPPATPPTGSAGPYTTAALCASSPCTDPATPAQGGTASCCSRTLNATLFVVVSGVGTITLTWNGTRWEGNGALTGACAGTQAYFRYDTSCNLFSSCDGTTFALVPSLGTTIICTPLFSVTNYSVNYNNGVGGCSFAGCGIRTATIGE